MAYTEKRHGNTYDQTNFATRKLAFVVVDMGSDVESNYDEIGSLYQLAVQGIQQVGELYALGRPNGNYFTAVISDDTLPYGDGQSLGDGGRNSALEAAINETTGASVSAWNAALNGDSLNYD